MLYSCTNMATVDVKGLSMYYNTVIHTNKANSDYFYTANEAWNCERTITRKHHGFGDEVASDDQLDGVWVISHVCGPRADHNAGIGVKVIHLELRLNPTSNTYNTSQTNTDKCFFWCWDHWPCVFLNIHVTYERPVQLELKDPV